MIGIVQHLSDLKDEWYTFGSFAVKWFSEWRTHYDKINSSLLRNLVAGKRRTKEEKIAIRNVEDESIADLNYVKLILEDAEKVECGAVIEALKDVSWTTIEINVN